MNNLLFRTSGSSPLTIPPNSHSTASCCLTNDIINHYIGLDGSKYNVGRIYDEDQDEEFTTLESQISDAERFKDAERLRIRCNLCKHEQIFEGMTRMKNDNEFVSGLECEACHGTISEAAVRSALIRCMRSYVRKYYEGWLVCDDATCGSRTRMMSVFGRRCLREGCHGSVKREVSHI